MEAVRPGLEQFGAASLPVTGMLADICGEVAAAFKQAWGRGPARISARWAGSDMLVLLLHNGQTEAEKTLRAAGHERQLLEARRLLQAAVEEELMSIVERATGRCVLTVLSGARLDPDLSAEIFLLGATSPGLPGSRPHPNPVARRRADRDRNHAERVMIAHPPERETPSPCA
jgi:uncharacterized protein YbcI